MLLPRAAGILLHPTSLPSPGGIGDMGPEAFRFVRWLADAGMKIWQVLPLGPTGYGDSPYQCFSAFAGNPLLIHVPEQARTHFGHNVAPESAHVCDFGTVIPAKRALLDAWLATLPIDEPVHRYVREQESWLPDYALFMALKEAHELGQRQGIRPVCIDRKEERGPASALCCAVKPAGMSHLCGVLHYHHEFLEGLLINRVDGAHGKVAFTRGEAIVLGSPEQAAAGPGEHYELTDLVD